MGLTGPEKDRSFKYNDARFESCSFKGSLYGILYTDIYLFLDRFLLIYSLYTGYTAKPDTLYRMFHT